MVLTTNAVAFDTLAFAKRLQDAGIPAKQAEAHAGAQADFLTHHWLSEVATKADFAALKISIAELETRLTMRMLLMAGVLATLMTLFKFIDS